MIRESIFEGAYRRKKNGNTTEKNLSVKARGKRPQGVPEEKTILEHLKIILFLSHYYRPLTVAVESLRKPDGPGTGRASGEGGLLFG
jgi:hypothetical protein